MWEFLSQVIFRANWNVFRNIIALLDWWWVRLIKNKDIFVFNNDRLQPPDPYKLKSMMYNVYAVSLLKYNKYMYKYCFIYIFNVNSYEYDYTALLPTIALHLCSINFVFFFSILWLPVSAIFNLLVSSGQRKTYDVCEKISIYINLHRLTKEKRPKNYKLCKLKRGNSLLQQLGCKLAQD